MSMNHRGRRPRENRGWYSLQQMTSDTTRAPLHKTYNDGNFAIYGNFHGNLEFDWLLSSVTMVVILVTIDGKVTINGRFYAVGYPCISKSCFALSNSF